MPFTIFAEKQLLKKERRLFLEKEIKHFGFICETLKRHNTNDSFYINGIEYANRLLAILSYMKEYEETCNEGSYEGIRKLVTVESIYSMLPMLFQNINNAHTIRKYKKLRLGQPSTKLRFALSEVHPDYAQTIRAIEIINSAYSRNLSTFFERFAFIPPTLVISRSSSWALYGFPDEDNLLFGMEDYCINSRKKLIEYFLILSWISLPRWVPIHMRFACILAHENFHRVLQVADLATQDLRALGSEPGATTQENVNYLESELYGPHLIEIVKCYHTIGDGLDRLLLELRFPNKLAQHLLSNDPATPLLGSSYWVHCRGVTQLSAFRMANEFISDIGAALIAGPSYVFAMLCNPEWTNQGTLQSLAPMDLASHPPLRNRIELLIEILDWLQFKEMAGECRRRLEEHLPNVATTEYEFRIIQAFRNAITTNIEFFHRTTEFLLGLMPDCAGGRLKRGELDEKDWIEEKNEMILKGLNGLFYQIDTCPEEVVNAIWHKKVFHPELSERKGHTAWRVILCNCRT